MRWTRSLGTVARACVATCVAAVLCATATVWAGGQRAGATDTSVLRRDLAAAVTARDIRRAIDLYTQVTQRENKPDPAALQSIALAAAAGLAADVDLEARIGACGAALGLDPRHAECRRALEALKTAAKDIDEQGWAVFALANAGIAQRPEDVTRLTESMTQGMRARLAREMTHVRPADRLALLFELINSSNMQLRYRAAWILGDIPGSEARDALFVAQANSAQTPARIPITVGLAKHGVEASVLAVVEMLPNLGDSEKIQAAYALARARNPRGLAVLSLALKSTVDLERIEAAEAMAEINADDGRRVILEELTKGSPPTRARALPAAGMLKLGLEPVVYGRLADPSPTVRAAAIAAIRETLASPVPAAPPFRP
jgi:hypothetical protein